MKFIFMCPLTLYCIFPVAFLEDFILHTGEICRQLINILIICIVGVKFSKGICVFILERSMLKAHN